VNTAPYYTGDNVPLKFTVSDATGAVNPTSAKVMIVKPPLGDIIPEVDATISENEVSYVVPIDVTDIDGEYHAFFVMILPGDLTRTHKMEFTVLHNPS